MQSSPRIASWWDNLPLFGQPLHHCVPSLKQQVAKETPAQRFNALSGKGNSLPFVSLLSWVRRWNRRCFVILVRQGLRFRASDDSSVHAGMALTRELEEGEAAFKKRFQQVFGNADDKGRLHQGMPLKCP